MDDFFIKSQTVDVFIDDLKEVLPVLQDCIILRNPEKCIFRVKSKKFLGYMVFSQGIEANLDKV